MKKLVLSIVILCGFSISLLAQGIQFREGSWKEILEIAKKENKLVFVDNYTSWCGPCKKMVSEVFPLKEVGDFYNANFICYKLDCEKGDGVEWQKHTKLCRSLLICTWVGTGNYFSVPERICLLKSLLKRGK